MLSLDALDTRRSVPTRQLAAPGPDAATLQRMLTTTVRVPDHGKRVPFRFLRISGDARMALADAGIGFHLSEVKGPVMDRLNTTDILQQLNGGVFLSQHAAVCALRQQLQLASLPQFQ